MTVGVRVENLCVSFFGRQVLRNITVDFPKKSLSVLIGRSGSGKTTLLRSVNRLNEEFDGCSTSGQIYLSMGQGTQAIYPSSSNPLPSKTLLTELRLRVGMLFQTPNVFPVSIFRNIAMPLTLVGGCPQSLVEERVHDSLHLVGLWDEVKDSLAKPAERLSGGQQQRLCLARVLALRPEILLLDEPTASLDVHASRHIEDVLSKLAEEYTIIMVSHGLAQARRLGQQLLVCEDGHITHQLQDSDELSESLLESMV